MRDEQNRVRELIRDCHLQAPASARCLDLMSEVGEVAKELLKASEYGREEIVQPTDETAGELGDCLFSLLALCEALNIDAGQALDGAINKYLARWKSRGDVGSGR